MQSAVRPKYLIIVYILYTLIYEIHYHERAYEYGIKYRNIQYNIHYNNIKCHNYNYNNYPLQSFQRHVLVPILI